MAEQNEKGSRNGGIRSSAAHNELDSFKSGLFPVMIEFGGIESAAWHKALQLPVFKPGKVNSKKRIAQAIWDKDWRNRGDGKAITTLQAMVKQITWRMENDEDWGKFATNYTKEASLNFNVGGITLKNVLEKAPEYGVDRSLTRELHNQELCAFLVASTDNDERREVQSRAVAHQPGLQLLLKRQQRCRARTTIVDEWGGGEAFQHSFCAGHNLEGRGRSLHSLIVEIDNPPEGYVRPPSHGEWSELNVRSRFVADLSCGSVGERAVETIENGHSNKMMNLKIDLGSNNTDKATCRNPEKLAASLA